MNDTPCISNACALYGGISGVPSPPLVANLPGHAGTDPVGWNIPALKKSVHIHVSFC